MELANRKMGSAEEEENNMVALGINGWKQDGRGGGRTVGKDG